MIKIKLKTILFISAFVLLVGGFLVVQQVFGVGLGTPLDMGGRDITNIAGLTATGNVKGGGLCIGADCRTSWPTGGVATCDVCDSRFVNVSGDSVTGGLTVSGDVGIGTVIPERKLHIGGGNILLDNTRTLEAKNAAGGIETWMWPRWSDNVMYTNYGSAGWNIRNNSSVSTMFLTNGGDIGIGTITPPNKLQVVGSIGATNWIGAGCEGSCEVSGGYSLLYPGGYGVLTSGLKVGAWEQMTGGNIKADGSVRGSSLCIGANCRTTWPTGDNLGDHTATQNINVNNFQMLNMRIENRTSDPGAAQTGQMWICTDAGNDCQ